jgi:hypothetical protein
MPEVIVIDEIGTDLEASAARTIAERGVQLIATAHGNTLENLVMNPTLSDLVGGVQSVTLGDEEARRRGTQKAILERRAPPTFDVLVEIQSFSRVAVHRDVADVVDGLLRGRPAQPEHRELDDAGAVRLAEAEPARAVPARPPEPPPRPPRRRLFPFGVSRHRLVQALRRIGLRAEIVDDVDEADVVLTARSFTRRKPQPLRDAEERGLPIHVVRNSTVPQLQQCLLAILRSQPDDPVAAALREAEDAVAEVLGTDAPVDLAPQPAPIRRLQHVVGQRRNLATRSVGQEPRRHVRILPVPEA